MFPDVYAPSELAPDLELRSRAAFVLVSERGGVLAGYSAALLLGADCGPKDAPAEVLLPSYTRGHQGLRVSRAAVSESDVVTVEGCRITRAERTAWDLVRRVPLLEAVVALDMLSRVGGFEPGELRARRRVNPRAQGLSTLEKTIALADPRAESAMETRLRVALVSATRLRVALVSAGLPPPEVQYRIPDEFGLFVARADLAYLDAKLAIEYDGSGHYDPRRHQRDLERDGLLASLGWETRRINSDGMGLALPGTVRRIHQLLIVRAPARYSCIEIDTSPVVDLVSA